VLVEERDPREDRQGIREERRGPRRGERAAPLEPELQRHERRAVREQHDRDEHQPAAAEGGRLGGDVAGPVEHAGGDAERGCRGDERAAEDCNGRHGAAAEQDREHGGRARVRDGLRSPS